MPMIDFLAVRKAISIRRVLEIIRYRVYRSAGHNGYGPCPLKCSHDNRCCSVSYTRNLWKCHRCNIGGNQLDLFAFVYAMPLYEATKYLCQQAGIDLPVLETGADLQRRLHQ